MKEGVSHGTRKIYPKLMLSTETPVNFDDTDTSRFISFSFARELAEVPPSKHKCYECYKSCCGSFFGFIGTICSCCNCSPYIVVPQGMAGIQTRFGKAYRVVDPGLYFVNQTCESMHLIDVKMSVLDVPQQIVTTKDNVIVNIDSVVYWRIINPFIATFHVVDITSALKFHTIATLRDIIGTFALQELIENRKKLSITIKEIIDKIATSWGVEIEAILINDIKLTEELQEIMSAGIKQQRLGASKLITAEAEVQASRLMREASDALNTPVAVQMRHLETMVSMSKCPDTKVIFTPNIMRVTKK